MKVKYVISRGTRKWVIISTIYNKKCGCNKGRVHLGKYTQTYLLQVEVNVLTR